MKRYVFVVLAIALLFGCFGGQDAELYVVPDKADSYMIVKPAAILADQDFMKAMRENSKQNFDESLNEMKEQTGVDPYSVTKVIIFMKTDVSNAGIPDGDSYGGLVAYAAFEPQKMVSKMRENQTVSEEQYDGVTVYTWETESKAYYGVPKKTTSALAFLNSKTAVFGSVEAVKDCIDVKNGKRKALKDERLDKAVGAVDSGAMFLAAIKVPNYYSSALSDSSNTGSPFDTKSFSKATHLAFSYNKVGTNNVLKSSILFQKPTDAEKAKDVLVGLVSMLKGFTKSESASEKIMKDLSVKSNDDMVLLELTVSKDTLDKLRDEMNTTSQSYGSGSGSYGTGSAYGSGYENDYGSSNGGYGSGSSGSGTSPSYGGSNGAYGSAPQESQDTCLMPVGFRCENYYLSKDSGVLSVELSNGLQKTVVVTDISCTKKSSQYEPCDVYRCNGYDEELNGVEIAPGSASEFSTACNDQNGEAIGFEPTDSFSGKLQVQYYFKDEGPKALRKIVGNILVGTG